MIPIHKPRITIFLSFFILFFLCGFERFEQEYVLDPIVYPPIADFIISYNRIIIGLFLFLGLFDIFILGRPLFYRRISVVGVLVLFNCFLSFKMLLNGNEEWARNIYGSMILLAIFATCFEFFRYEESEDLFYEWAFYIPVLWLLMVLYMYSVGGEDSILWDDRYFFFSSHMNHSGAVWVIASLLYVSYWFQASGRVRVFFTILLFGVISCLVMTGSRGAFISFLSALLVYVWLRRVRYLGIYISIGVLIFLAFGFQALFSDVVAHQVGRGNTREVVYAVAVEDFFDNILVGKMIPFGRALYVENSFLAFLQLGGLCGFFCFIFFYKKCFHALILAIRLAKDDELFKLMVAFLVGGLIFSLFEASPLNFISAGSFLFMMPMAKILSFNASKFAK